MKRKLVLFVGLPLLMSLLAAIALNYLISSFVINQTKQHIKNVLLSNRGFHQYIQKVMHPAFFASVGKGHIARDYYDPQFLSSTYIIRTMHTFYNEEREKCGMVRVYYKMAANNPRNPVNKADAEEARLVRLFNENRVLREYERIVKVEGKKFLYYAIPFMPNEKRCLRCHGDPGDAPLGLRQMYPGEGGFREKLGEIRAIESVRIPIDEEEFTALKITGPISSGIFVMIVLFFFNTGLRRSVKEKTKGLEAEISERQKAEAALKVAVKKAVDEREKTEAIIAGIGEGLSIQDTEYRVMYQNQAHKDFIGEHLGDYCYKAYEKKDAVCDGCALALSFQDGQVHRTERKVLFPDGMRYFDITTSPIKDSDGNIVAGVEAVREMTEQRLASESVEAEKERLTVTLRSIGDGVIVTDTLSRITLLNRVAEEITGWKDEEARGRPLAEVFNIINETTRQKCENPIDQVLRTGMVIGLANHTALIRRDGTEIIIADSAAPIHDRQSRTIGIVLVFRDITAQYRMEQEMQKMQKLESLGILAGGLAHDFNNLLTAIIGNLSLAKMYTGVDHRAFERLSSAEKAAQRATDLTQQLLTFAKGGAPVKKLASIPEVVKEAVNFALSGSSIKCLYNVPSALWSAEMDKGQMSQVFNNLIINSIHAMPEGGTIRIRFENRTVHDGEVPSLSAGDYVKITFHDEGAGIPEEIRGKIFEPYFTTKKDGSGLGLATVFSILKRHDGLITVESTPRVGTTFYIYVPAVRDVVYSETEEIEGIQPGHGRVLIMDDELLVRNVGGEILKALGYEVGFAKDGAEALEAYKQAENEHRPFDVVIMDLTIPGGIGGKETIRKLLEFAPNAKVIVSSGYSADPIMADYMKYGFCGVITKPYNVNQVSEIISRTMKKSDA